MIVVEDIKIRNINKLQNLIDKRTNLHLKNINKWLEELPLEVLEKFSDIQYQINKSNMKESEYKDWIVIGINDFIFFQKIKYEEIQNDEMWESVENKNLLVELEQKKPEFAHYIFDKIVYINKLLEFMNKNIEKRFSFYKINLEANPIY